MNKLLVHICDLFENYASSGLQTGEQWYLPRLKKQDCDQRVAGTIIWTGRIMCIGKVNKQHPSYINTTALQCRLRRILCDIRMDSMQQWPGNCARERWQEGGGEVQLMLGSKRGRGGIKEWMKLKVVRFRGVKREGDMMRARKEGQKRCLISRTPPSPFALSGGGSLNPHPHPHPTPQNTALWNFPRQAEGRRARVSAEEKQPGSD